MKEMKPKHPVFSWTLRGSKKKHFFLRSLLARYVYVCPLVRS
jgi:hypothetical protein